MHKIAILIPCFNEEKTIERVINDFKIELPDAQIYVYDNNSTDNTAKLAERAGAIVRKERLQGKGNVVRRMFREIDAECYIMVDGDDTYNAKHAKEMANLVLNDNVDMVIGDRLSSTYFKENKRMFHNFGNSLVRFIINKLFHSNISDIMTGYRAFSYEFVKTFPVISKGFEIETEMTVHSVVNNMSTYNVVVDYKDRENGSESKLNTIRDGIIVLKTIFKLFKNYKPLLFFSILAILLIIIDFMMLIPLLITYVNTGLVPRFPTLIICGFIALIAVLLVSIGLILDVLIENHRQTFEFKLQIINTMKKELKHDRNNEENN